MVHLFFSQAAASACPSAGAALLVGQRCPALSSSPVASSPPGVVVVVAECVPCGDSSVVDEQVECLARVLPFGIEVVGVSGSAGEVVDLRAHLCGEKTREWVAVVCADGHIQRTACHALGAPSTTVEVAEAEVAFVEVRLALHSCEESLPLLLTTARGEPPVLLDGESCTAWSDAAPSLDSGLQCVQLGAASKTLRIHVVLAPAFASVKGTYEVLRRQLNAAVAAGTTRLVEVQSHNTHISYCCRMEPGAGGQGSELSAHALDEVFELIEDATGAAARRSDVKGFTPAMDVRKAGTSTNAGEAASPIAQRSGGEDTTSMMLFIALATVLFGVAIVLMQ